MSRPEYETECAIAAMRWYGWGSPIGLSIFFITLSGCALLIRLAFCG